MYEVKDKNKTLLFSNKTDADNYIDYLQHGLKCIAKKDRTYCFNNGARLIDVSLYGTNNEKFVLHYNNKCIVSKTLQKKLSIILAMILLLIVLCSTAEAMITLPFGYYTHNGFKIIYTTKAVCIGVNTLMTRDGQIWEYENNNFVIGDKYRITFSDNGTENDKMDDKILSVKKCH